MYFLLMYVLFTVIEVGLTLGLFRVQTIIKCAVRRGGDSAFIFGWQVEWHSAPVGPTWTKIGIRKNPIIIHYQCIWGW